MHDHNIGIAQHGLVLPAFKEGCTSAIFGSFRVPVLNEDLKTLTSRNIIKGIYKPVERKLLRSHRSKNPHDSIPL